MEIAITVSVLFAGSFSRSALGFGDALVAMPLLVLIMPASKAAPLVALCACTTAAIVLAREWRHVNVRAATSLIVAGLLAAPFGVWWLKHGDDRIAKGILATIVISFTGWSLWKPDLFRLQTDRWAPVFGFTSGLLSGAFNTGGPPLVVYGALRRWPPARFRAVFQAYTIIAGGLVAVLHASAGSITREIVLLYAYSLPAIASAAWIGRKLTHSLSTQRFLKVVYCFLMVIGIGLLISCFRSATTVGG